MPPSAGSPSASPATDLARRIAARRKEKHMGIDELATAAGIDPGYLSYFERSPNANLSGGTLLLIALALDTSPRELLGGTKDTPAGRGRARSHASLNELTAEQCETHLSANGVGRIVYTTPRGPVALPVNYEFTEGQVVFSTDDAKASALAATDAVGFEIDRVDDVLSEGWSVLVSGPCRRVQDPGEVQRLSSLGLEPWAGGDRHELMAITPAAVTGRVIVHESPADED
jgi:transcriptional regulator with XRE-family HTH domain